MSLRIEEASLSDLSRLFEIEKECFTKEAFTKEQISYLLTDHNNVSLTAKINDEIVGFIIGRIYVHEKPVVGHVLTIDVSPEHRRRGIGLKLLKAVENVFRKRNVAICYLEAREDNVAALNLYRKQGYGRVKKLKNYYGYVHGIRFKKVLT